MSNQRRTVAASDQQANKGYLSIFPIKNRFQENFKQTLFSIQLCNKQKLAKQGHTRLSSVDPESLTKEDAQLSNSTIYHNRNTTKHLTHNFDPYFKNLGAIQKIKLIVSALKSLMKITSLHPRLHIAWETIQTLKIFVHNDCDGLNREDKPYMTELLAYAVYGYHLRKLQASPQSRRNSLSYYVELYLLVAQNGHQLIAV